MAAGASGAEQVRAFDVAPQPLASALLEIARQGDIDILAAEDLTQGLRAPGIHGRMTARQAIERVLRTSGLTFRIAPDGTVVVARRPPVAPPARETLRPRPAGEVPRPVSRTPAATTAPAEDIIVRAERRSEDARDLPISISSFDGDTLARAGVQKFMDLQQVDPALVTSAQSGAIIPFLRGIGNPASSTPGNESSVPVYIDDVYFSRLYPAYLAFDNIARAEILKGPQGTLFGRNATGGLIQIFTRDPGSTPELDAELGQANYRTRTGSVYLSAPLTGTLSANLSGSFRSQGTGWGRNFATGGDAYFTGYRFLRSKLVWMPGAETTLRLSGFHVSERSSTGTVQGGGFAQFPRGLPPDYAAAFVLPRGFYDINADFPTVRHHKGWGVSLKLEQGLGFADLASISFYRHAKDPWSSEGDHTPYPWLQYQLDVADREITQEFQLKSRSGSPVKWIMGFYYMDAEAGINPTAITGEAITRMGYSSISLKGRQTIVSRAGYAQATLPFNTGRTHLTAGVRYTRDRVHAVGADRAIAAGTGESIALRPGINDTSRFGRMTYRLALDHRLSGGSLAYLSFSRGFKSGTYNLLPLELPALDPERVDAYEAGIKAAILDDRLRINLAAFWNDIKNPQVQIVKNVGGVATNQFVNAERSRSRGLEFSAFYTLSDHFGLHVAGQVLDSRFERFHNAPINVPLQVPPFGVVTTTGDASGNRTPLSPRFKLNLGASHSAQVGSISLRVDGNLSHRSAFKWEPDNTITQPQLTLLNASVTLRPDALPCWSMRLWANNITARRYHSNVLTQTGPVGFMASPAEPRTFGMTLRYSM